MAATIEILEDTDMFEVGADALAHGCNVRGAFGAGVAGIMAKKFPEVASGYRSFIGYQGGSEAQERLLGTALIYDGDDDTPIIYNLFTQVEPGPDGRLEEGIRPALKYMLQDAHEQNLETIAMPAIGCGIAGLNWSDVYPVVVEEAAKTNWTGTLKICFIGSVLS